MGTFDAHRTIESDEDAIQLLEELLEVKELPADFDLTFKDWPKVTLGFKGDRYESTLPTSVMYPILDLQKELNKLYSLLKYGEANPKKLKFSDREAIEILVKVKGGSSVVDLLLDDQWTTLFSEAISKMTPEQIANVLIVFALTAGSVWSWKSWLNHRAKQLDRKSAVELSKIEKEKLEVMAKAVKQVPQMEQFQEGLDDFKHEVLKKLDPKDKLIVTSDESEGVVEVPGHYAEEITQEKREASKEIRLDGIYKIITVESGDLEGYRLKVRKVEDHSIMYIDVLQSVVTPSLKKLLMDSEWEKQAISMQINAMSLRGQITKASLVSAEKYEPDE